MLELENLVLEIHQSAPRRRLLDGVSARLPRSHFAAVIGPSGCGKTTLLKFIAGIAQGREFGSVKWMGRDLSEADFDANEISYVPQFNLAHEELTARECVEFSLALRDTNSTRSRNELAESLLSEVGLSAQSEQLVRTLSGGQRRRLALAVELTNRPEILLCDEVTSGLDLQAEKEIVELLRSISRTNGRLVLSVTHSLDHLELYDSVLVLYEGMVAYFGPPSALLGYFQVGNPEQLFARLLEHAPQAWAQSWGEGVCEVGGGEECHLDGEPEHVPPAALPGRLSQFATLVARRWLILARSPSQIVLHLCLVAGFPLLVAIFAWGGLPEVKNMEMGLTDDLSRALEGRLEFVEHASEVGSVVSGIVMFQVVLLCLMGANNSGREIASERAIFEKERLAGLRPSAYVAAKAAYLSAFVLVQSLWMASFVRLVCGIPGDFLPQLGFLALVNGAVTAVCLGISSLLDSPEQSSLASIYLVGFQLPLSGAVLALPDLLAPFVRPFIAAYWGWSGFLETLENERYYDIVAIVAQTELSSGALSASVLLVHILGGLALAWIGCERHRHS